MASEVVEIQRLYDQLVAAAVGGDPDEYAALFTGDAVLMPPNAAVIAGRDAIRAWMRAFFRTWRAEISTLSFDQRQRGDTVAFCRFSASGKYIPVAGGEPFAFDQKYLDTIVRDASGTWKFAAHMWSSNTRDRSLWAQEVSRHERR